MGSVKKRADGVWRARWREVDGTERAKHFATQRQAQDYLTEVTADMLRGEYITEADKSVTFGVYADQWRLAQIHRPSTGERTETLIRLYMGQWDRRTLGSIRPTEVQAWVRSLTDTLAPATTASVYQLFATIMRAAVTDRLLNRTPCVRIQLPTTEHVKVVPLPAEVVVELAEQIRPELHAAVMISACAGLRISECMGVTVDRVDFLRRTITVDRQLLAPTGGGTVFGPPKTRASKRIIPIGSMLTEVLASHLAEHGAGPDGLITSYRGEAVRRANAARAFRVARDRIADCPPDATWHDLRHFYASALIAGGASVAAVQARLGHATAAETLDTYTHLFPAEDDRTRAVIDGAFGFLADSVRTKDA